MSDGLKLNFALEGGTTYQRHLETTIGRLRNMGPALKRVDAELRAELAETSAGDSGASRSGNEYAAWKSEYYPGRGSGSAPGVRGTERSAQPPTQSPTRGSRREAGFGAVLPGGRSMPGAGRLSPAVRERFVRIVAEFVEKGL